MARDKKHTRKINYLSRDFSSIKNELIDQAKIYYPDTYKDFSEASFGSLMLDTVAYTGDVLSFYLDYAANESFMDTALEYNNVLRHARQLGFKFRGVPSTHGVVAIYSIVPATTSGMGIDPNYLPTLRRGSSFSGDNGASFLLVEDMYFDSFKHTHVVARTNSDTGMPTHYAIKAYARVISGKMGQKTVTVGGHERFLKVKVPASNIAEILKIVDEEGHQYYEVDYLSQNVVYKDIVNSEASSDGVPSILKPFVVPRRFVVERERNSTFLQFGFGSESELTGSSVAEPTNVVLDMFGRDYITDTSFDPAKLLNTDKFGVAPSNTNISITYRTVTAANANASVGSITKVSNTLVEFANPLVLTKEKRKDVVNSFEVYNEEPIIGDVSLPTTEELKRRTLDHFATQNRAVTQKDYEAVTYAMPERYGAVRRCKIVRDLDSIKRNLNLYVLGEDSSGHLASANNTVKNNLKTWLNQYKMMNDTIDIIDAKIINIQIEYSVVATHDSNKYDVLQATQDAIKAKYANPTYIGEPFYISEIQNILNKIEGVSDVKRVKVIQNVGGNYSDFRFDIKANTSPDGRYIIMPHNVAFEIKFPDSDIKGTVM